MNETQWLEASIQKWMAEAKDIPTRAVLYVAQSVYLEQNKRLEAHKGQLDGNAWSREAWNRNK